MCVVLGIHPRASYILGKHSALCPLDYIYPQPQERNITSQKLVKEPVIFIVVLNLKYLRFTKQQEDSQWKPHLDPSADVA